MSHVQGHEIRIVLHARLDGGDLLLYQSRLHGLYTDAPPPWLVSALQVGGWCTERVNTRLYNQTVVYVIALIGLY